MARPPDRRPGRALAGYGLPGRPVGLLRRAARVAARLGVDEAAAYEVILTIASLVLILACVAVDVAICLGIVSLW